MDTSRFAVPLESDNEIPGKGPLKAPAENGPVGATPQSEGKESKEGAGDVAQGPAPVETEAGEYRLWQGR